MICSPPPKAPEKPVLTRPAEVVHAESAGMLSLSCGLVAVSLCLAVTYQGHLPKGEDMAAVERPIVRCKA